MNFSAVVVLALAVLLVPAFSEDIRDRRCELRDQLRAALSPKNQRDYKLARVICEVEKFANQSSVNPTSSPPASDSPSTAPSSSNTQSTAASGQGQGQGQGHSSSEGDSSEEKSGHGGAGVDTYLKDCVAVTNGSVIVNASCFGENHVFEKVFLNAGEECKMVASNGFFQNCSNSDQSNSEEQSLSKEQSKDKSHSKEQSNSKEKSNSKSSSKSGQKSRH